MWCFRHQKMTLILSVREIDSKDFYYKDYEYLLRERQAAITRRFDG